MKRPMNRCAKISKIWTVMACAILAASWAWASEPAPPPDPQSSQAKEAEEGSEKDPREEKKLERFRAAASKLESSTEVEDSLRALKVLRGGFPDSRPVLHDCADRGASHVKCFAIEILGEQGEAKKDMEAVAEGLKDTHPKVRLAAIMAIQRLGKSGAKAIREHLPREGDPNNKKMAIKTLQRFKDKEAVPVLVRILQIEKDKGVRNFAVNALEVLSSRKLGDDVKAWEEYSEELATQEQARELMDVKELWKEKER